MTQHSYSYFIFFYICTVCVGTYILVRMLCALLATTWAGLLLPHRNRHKMQNVQRVVPTTTTRDSPEGADVLITRRLTTCGSHWRVQCNERRATTNSFQSAIVADRASGSLSNRLGQRDVVPRNESWVNFWKTTRRRKRSEELSHRVHCMAVCIMRARVNRRLDSTRRTLYTTVFIIQNDRRVTVLNKSAAVDLGTVFSVRRKSWD